ncbi:MAG TPA: hypothetical protein VMT92_08170 [Steroidobacteraceae bacterium]|nr:hypothetical protein [Steroidobacteraceae bacterium]
MQVRHTDAARPCARHRATRPRTSRLASVFERLRAPLGTVGAGLLLAAIASCAARPDVAYSDIATRTAAVSVEEALQGNPNATTALAKDHDFRITRDSAVLADGEVRAGYELVGIELAHAQALSITTRSFCECLGARAYVMVPKVRAIDGSGTEVPLEPGDIRWRSPDWTHPASVMRGWRSAVLPAGRYRILLYADNTRPGKLLAQQSQVNVLIAAPVVVPMKTTAGAISYPYGKASVRIE